MARLKAAAVAKYFRQVRTRRMNSFDLVNIAITDAPGPFKRLARQCSIGSAFAGIESSRTLINASASPRAT